MQPCWTEQRIILCRMLRQQFTSEAYTTIQQQVREHHYVHVLDICIVFLLPQVSDPSGGAMFVADPKKPVGGHVLAHASTIRISLRKGKGEQRLMKVVDAPNLREAQRPSLKACSHTMSCTWHAPWPPHAILASGHRDFTVMASAAHS